MTDSSSSTRSSRLRSSAPCEDPRCSSADPQTYYCIDCSSNYCSSCWPLQGPHRPGKVGRDGVVHEKTDLRIVNRLTNVLQGSQSIEELQAAHEADAITTWFGISKSLTGQAIFEDYGRYANLMSSILPPSQQTNRYPQLTSFIGETNAGKSALIKMLISRANATRDDPDAEYNYPGPVVGSMLHDTVATSGDVNLYADPASNTDALPVLYADCEGFQGGERFPLGAIARRKGDSEGRRGDRPRIPSSHSRVIEWATTDETRQREFAVANLYPKLLYTFSDVVVFVLRNPKTFQSAVLNRLLDWGASALEKSINQPALPHAIVVLNATDPGVDDREWDTNYATQSLLSSVKDALDYVEGVPKLRKLADYWKTLGKNIHTVEDLILRYYSSFQVIRVPAKPRYMLMDDQVEKLQKMIRSGCQKSFQAKRRARMLTNADELNSYYQAGFSHFTTHLDIPFNFVEVSLRNNPIPYDFGGHILQLTTTIAKQYPKQDGRAEWMFEKLAVMLASCVMLDCARFRKGRMEDLFGNYEQFFDWALAEFFELHWPCSFAVGERRCQLVRARHEVKGHQDAGGILAAGDYQTGISSDKFTSRFKAQLRSAIGSIQRDFHYESEQLNQTSTHVPDEKIAVDLHKEYIDQFYATVGPANQLYSHASCFSCLMSTPTHPLPCGHVICQACLGAFGKPVGRSTIMLPFCPLHRDETRWSKPPQIHLKPRDAGVRVLSLDGGGIRGIVQLEVLREIEQVLGSHLPIQAFFDLIVGTGTGGIIAAALGIQQKPINTQILDMFTAICDVAYAPRVKGMPLLKLAAILGGGSAYKTEPLRNALATAFGEQDRMFGGVTSDTTRQPLKVAVTSTTATGKGTILLANYRRQEDHCPWYELERPHEPSLELKVWEAMAATSATPTYFKPFLHESTHRSYLDGCVRFVNPTYIADRERKLIWPDVAHRDPDLMLSIGTGQNRFQVLSRLADHARVVTSQRTKPDKPKANSLFRQAANIISNRSDDILNAELAWAGFKSNVQGPMDQSGRRYVRFNPDLDTDPPNVDAKTDLRNLQTTVRKRLWLPHRQAALQHVGHRLVASSFYFEMTIQKAKSRSMFGCAGTINCRFDDGSEYLRGLGKVLASRQTSSFQPYFLVKGNEGDELGLRLPVSEAMIDGMITHSTFIIKGVEIPISDDTKPTSINLFLTEHEGLEPDGFAISGFPRTLLVDSRPDRKRGESKSSESIRSPDQMLSNHPNKSPALRRTSDDISLNQTKVKTFQPSAEKKPNLSPVDSLDDGSGTRPSLYDSLAQHDPAHGLNKDTNGYSNNSGNHTRTNRFWTYIGPQHMARNPQNYTADELFKFAGDLTADLALPSPVSHHVSSATEVSSESQYAELPSNELTELEANEASPVSGGGSNKSGASRSRPPSYVPRRAPSERTVGSNQRVNRPSTDRRSSQNSPIVNRDTVHQNGNSVRDGGVGGGAGGGGGRKSTSSRSLSEISAQTAESGVLNTHPHRKFVVEYPPRFPAKSPGFEMGELEQALASAQLEEVTDSD